MRSALNKLVLYQQSNGFMTIREAVYGSEGDLDLLGGEPAFPRGLSVEDIRADLEEFYAALERPIIQEGEFDMVEQVDLDDFDIDGELPN